MNKTSSRVEIFWNVLGSRALTDEQRARLREKLASRLTTEGSIRVVASDMRSQSRNRELAEERLADLVRRALIVPKKRRATKADEGRKGGASRLKEAALDQETRSPGRAPRLIECSGDGSTRFVPISSPVSISLH